MPARRPSIPGDFDVVALWEAVDAQRAEREMTWNKVASTLAWMSAATIARMRETGISTCNHVLPMIEWVGRTPESFTIDPDGAVHDLLPDPEGRWRWWWAHHDLAAAVDAQRRARDLTWREVADEMGVDETAIKGIDKLRYGPTIGLAMIAARWLGRPAASFLTELPPSAFNAPRTVNRR